MLDGIIIRGTTPTHEFDLPFPENSISDIRVTYGQGRKQIFTKDKSQIKIDGNKIAISLKQVETLSFSPEKNVEIELRVRFTDGEVVRSEKPIVLRVIDSMDEEVLGGDV